MKYLIKIETKRLNMRSEIKALLITNLLIFPIAIIVLSSMEFVGTFIVPITLIDMSIKSIFGVWQALLISTLIIEEIKNKTMMQLYTYPVNRASIINSKLILIGVTMLVFQLITQLIQNSIFTFLDTFIPIFSYQISMQSIIFIVLTSMLSIVVGMIPLVAGLWTKSLIAPIITAIVLQGVFSNNITGENAVIGNFIVMLVLGIIGIIFVWVSIKDFNNNDLVN